MPNRAQEVDSAMTSPQRAPRAHPVGRRPGESGAREAIAAAARKNFAEHGYDRATVRGIARDAAVDPALVAHYFGSKQALFAAVIELPLDPSVVLPAILSGDRDKVGERMARFVVNLLESEARQSLVGLVRAATSEPEAAAAVRRIITTRVFAPATEALGLPDAELRANLIGAQTVGLVMARYVVAVEPLASLGADELIRVLTPTYHRYLAEPL